MKKVALINDLSGFGKCSLTAAIPVISVMGLQACPLPTAILSAQTGFPDYYYDDYTEKMVPYIEKWKEMDVQFDGIYSGFLGSTKQIAIVTDFLHHFKQQDTLYIADPVMGDHGEQFPIFNQQFLEAMKQLVVQADVITPNLTELCLLADISYEGLIQHASETDYQKRIEDIGRKVSDRAVSRQSIIVTGIIKSGATAVTIGNLAITPDSSYYLETPYTGKSFSGTGDLFASVITGCLVKEESLPTALQKAADFLSPAIEEATRNNVEGNHGVAFEHYLSRLC